MRASEERCRHAILNKRRHTSRFSGTCPFARKKPPQSTIHNDFSGGPHNEKTEEVPVLLEENNAVFISPMANPDIYSANASYAILEEENYAATISAVWKEDNPSPLIGAFANALKMLYT